MKNCRLDTAHLFAKSSSHANTFSTALDSIAAYIDLAFEERINMSVSAEVREREIKSLMIGHGWSNGKAAAYSKAVSRYADILLAVHGKTPSRAKTDFWILRHTEPDPRARTKRIREELKRYGQINGCHSVKDFFKLFSIQYGSSHKP